MLQFILFRTFTKLNIFFWIFYLFKPIVKLMVRGRSGSIPNTVFQLTVFRSEEHTSELQSRFDLVCRLLLEKKKTVHIQLTGVDGQIVPDRLIFNTTALSTHTRA